MIFKLGAEIIIFHVRKFRGRFGNIYVSPTAHGVANNAASSAAGIFLF